MAKPRVLFIAKDAPLGEAYGSRNRIKMTCDALEQIAELTIAIFSIESLPDDIRVALQNRYKIAALETLAFTPDTGGFSHLQREFDPRFMNIHWRQVNPQTAKKLTHSFDTYDVIWVHTQLIANAFRMFEWPRHAVLDIDDFHSQYHFSNAKHTKPLLKKINGYRLGMQNKRREQQLPKRFEHIVVCSEEDATQLAAYKNISIIPNSYATTDITSSVIERPSKRIGFIGGLYYKPNKQGITWFIEYVWPLIIAKQPDAELRVIGKNTKGHDAQTPNINFLGYIDKPETEMNTWNHCIVPIHIGSGTRVKIAEALAKKIPIVSTRLGAHGYLKLNDKHLLTADEAAPFAEKCLSLLQDKSLNEQLQTDGFNYYNARLSQEVITNNFFKVLNKVL